LRPPGFDFEILDLFLLSWFFRITTAPSVEVSGWICGDVSRISTAASKVQPFLPCGGAEGERVFSETQSLSTDCKTK
jgi:hypothetical protein